MESIQVISQHPNLVESVSKEQIALGCENLKTDNCTLEELISSEGRSDSKKIPRQKSTTFTEKKAKKKDLYYRAIETDYLTFRENLFYSILESKTSRTSKSVGVSVVCTQPYCACFPFARYWKKTRKCSERFFLDLISVY